MLVGDPGCLAAIGDRIDAKFAIGSAVGVADGLVRAGIRDRAVALFGDSSFFHSTLPAIVNAVHHRSDLLMVVLDNGATVTSGFQPSPGQPRDAFGRPAPALDIEKIARAIGVESAVTVGPDDLDGGFRGLPRGAVPSGARADRRPHAVRAAGVTGPSLPRDPRRDRGHPRRPTMKSTTGFGSFGAVG